MFPAPWIIQTCETAGNTLKNTIMSYLKLPNRAFNSPLIRFANFKDGSHVNLIRLSKPYANGLSFAVHETTKSPFCSNGMFKTLEEAEEKFNLMVKNAQTESSLLKSGKTQNY